MDEIVLHATERYRIQCHLWSCDRTIQPYCSVAHSGLAASGEANNTAIAFIDGVDNNIIHQIAKKFFRSKQQRRRTGIPYLAGELVCTNPWELGHAVFYRELEVNEARRIWLFESLTAIEGFGELWKVYGRSIHITAHIISQTYSLARYLESPGGSFTLTKLSDPEENTALYSLRFMPAEAGKGCLFFPAPVPQPIGPDANNPCPDSTGQAVD